VGGLVGDAGEFGLLDALLPRLRQGSHVRVGPGDDAAVLDLGSPLVASVDVLVEGVHFRRDWSSAADVGHKSAAVNMADVAAMGAAPVALLVGLTLPSDVPVAWVAEMADGLAAEADPLGCSVVGGDTVAGPVLSIAVTALGVPPGPVVTRAGARPGDVVAVAGGLGRAAAGLAVLRRGFRSPRALVDAQRRPQPPYPAGPQAAALGASAMVDVSDGLLADLGHVAAASGVAVEIDAARLAVGDDLVAMGRGLGLDPLRWVLTGGEDHALAACFPAGTSLPPEWTVVGAVSDGEGVRVPGVDTEGWAGGWEHFAPPG
jgi:thiamine-monophosphate kinase